MSAPTDPDRERTLRRRHKRERQAVVFGLLIAALAVGALGAVAVFTGGIDAPFSRPFTTLSPTASPPVETPPCPPEGTLPVAYGEVQVRVLNATDRNGLAGQTADALTARGFVVAAVGNAASPVTGVARISFGGPGVGAAYTLAAHLEGARLLLDERTDSTVDLALGSEFVSLLDPGVIPLDPNAPLVGRDGCVPIDQAEVSSEPAETAPEPEQPAG